MGFVVAANPFGQMIFSPLVGWWSNKLGSIRIPLIVSLIVFTLASGMYSSLELFPSYRKHWMLWSRFMVGVSSGKKTIRLHVTVLHYSAGSTMGLVILLGRHY